MDALYTLVEADQHLDTVAAEVVREDADITQEDAGFRVFDVRL